MTEIPEKAIEPAVKELFDGRGESSVLPYVKQKYLTRAEAALKAAAPFMEAHDEWLASECMRLRSLGTFNEGIEAAAQYAESFPYTGDPQSILGMRSRSIAAEIRALKREQ